MMSEKEKEKWPGVMEAIIREIGRKECLTVLVKLVLWRYLQNQRIKTTNGSLWKQRLSTRVRRFKSKRRIKKITPNSLRDSLANQKTQQPDE